MPLYDPTLRGAGSNLSTGGLASFAVGTAGAQNGDTFIVTGIVNGAIQINPPDGTWTRINGDVTGYQSFSKIFSVGMNVTFSWDGNPRAFVFNEYAVYSAGGGTISVNAAITKPDSGSATSKTSNAITPAQNALVLVDFIEFVNAVLAALSAPFTPAQNHQGCAAGYEYVTAGVVSDTWTQPNGDPGTPHYWGSGTFALTSSIVNPVSPPFVDDEAAFTPAVNQTLKPAFVDDELAFTPSVGIGSMHTTTSNSEVATASTSAGTNLRVTEQSSEAATQVSLIGVAQLRATVVNAEVALQTLPPIGPVDFEIQTPSRQFDPAQLGMTKRIYIDVDCNRSGPTWGTPPQVLFPTLILDNIIEIPLPAITNNGRGVIEIAFQQKSRLVAIRLSNPQLRGRVEVFGIHWDNPIGRGPGES